MVHYQSLPSIYIGLVGLLTYRYSESQLHILHQKLFGLESPWLKSDFVCAGNCGRQSREKKMSKDVNGINYPTLRI